MRRIRKSQHRSDNTWTTSKGFTLVELIVVLIIIGILFTALTAIFNPFAQIQKARNATRQLNLNQIRNALDAYFNDTGCYPTTIPFGGRWSSGATIYMQSVPEDPDCSSSTPGYCYNYQTDGSSCPQWNILYAQMHAPIVSGMTGCLVSTAPNCLPVGGLASYNYCVVSGKLNCTYISQNQLPTPAAPGSGGSGGSGSGGGGAGASTPSPIPTNLCGSPNLSACSNGVCNAKVGQGNTCLGCGGSVYCYADLVCGNASDPNANCR